MNETIGFIGIGNMGAPMAENLLKAGYRLKVYNRTKEKLGPLIKLGAEAVDRPVDVVTPGGIVITMLANDDALKQVTLGPNGIINSLGPDSVHISMSTVSPDKSRKLALAHRKVGAWYVAATVSGRPDVAAAGKLGIYVSGEPAARQRAKPILQKLGRNISDCGDDPGAANVVKLAANFMLFSAIEAFAEALAYTEKEKLDRGAVVKMICDNIFDCAPYRGYGQLLAARDYEHPKFKLSLAFKDLRLALESSEATKTPMPFADSLHNRMLGLIATGKGDWDVSAIGRGVAEQAGLAK